MLSKNQVKELQSLQLKKNRDLRNVFVAEGIKTVTEIFEQRKEILKQVFAAQNFYQAHASRFHSEGIALVLVTDEELSKISLQSNPNQVFAVCNYLDDKLQNVDSSPFSFFLDDIRDPGNFGTIIRLADWFGINQVYCSQGTVDLYNPKVIQSTMGAFLRVQVNYCSLPEAISASGRSAVYGAVLDGNDLYKEILREGLLVIGNEANGISPENESLLTNRITIPNAHSSGTESLNAAIAASIIAAEFFRQLHR